MRPNTHVTTRVWLGAMLTLAVFFSGRGVLLSTAAAAEPAKPPQAGKKVPVRPQPPAANPLNQFLKRMFGGRNGGRRGIGGSSSNNSDGGTRNHLFRDPTDYRTPHDSSVESRLRRARELIQSKDWSNAFLQLQTLLNARSDSLYLSSDGRWKSVRLEVLRLLGDLPKQTLDLYRRTQTAVAQRLLDEAERSRDAEALAQVAIRYIYTGPGLVAFNRLASIHLDRGEFAIAAIWLQKLWQVKASFSDDLVWRVKFALALHQAGLTETAKPITTELLTAHGNETVQLGAASLTVVEALRLTPGNSAAQTPVLDDWPMLQGTPSHTGVSSGGPPLLLPRWSRLVTDFQPTRDQIALLVEDLRDEDRAAIPAFVPLTVGGKLVYRDLSGVQVVDVESGRVLWTTSERVPPDRLLNPTRTRALNNPQRQAIFGNQMLQVPEYVGPGADQHPLTSLLFRNGAYGIVSSDGQRLFVIEDGAVLSRYQAGIRLGASLRRADPYRRDWSSNKLVAYDLETGHPIWEIGGANTKEPFSLPLSGVYFLGAPVPFHDLLYVVGEKESEIRLYALNRVTGAVHWSQLIALADASIDRDLGRRWWSVQVAVGNGVVVCPTSVGWLVAVDPVSRTLLWAHRYAPRSTKREAPGRSTQTLVSYAPLNSRWCPAAPIIAGNRVLDTPPEAATLFGLDLIDGHVVWQKPKGDFLYVAGINAQQVILVGRHEVAAVRIEDGRTVWTTQIPRDAGCPSGRGVLLTNQLLLPLAAGELWTIQLQDGSVATKSYFPSQQHVLGNLCMYHGTLVSLHPLELTSFEQRDVIASQIAAHLSRDPHDPWARLRQVEVQRLHRDFAAAWESLQQIDADKLDPKFQSQYRDAKFTTLTNVVRSDSGQHARELQELENMAASQDERLLVQRLKAEGLVARQNFREALDIYWALADRLEDRHVNRWDNPHVTVRMDCWLRGKLVDLWARLPEDVRAEADTRVKQAVSELSSRSTVDQERYLAVFGFHPAAVPLRQRLAETYANGGDLVSAESLLRELAAESEPETATHALSQLARLLDTFDLEKDANSVYEQIARLFPEARLDDNRTAAEIVDERSVASNNGVSDSDTASSWGDVTFQVVRNGAHYASPVWEATISSSGNPFFRSHRFRFSQPNQRLEIRSALDDTLEWMVPLQLPTRISGNRLPLLRPVGHRLFVLYGNVLHCLAPAEHRVVWVKRLSLRGQNHQRTVVASPANASLLRPWAEIVSASRLLQTSSRNAPLATVNRNYVCIRDRRQFSVLDAGTGDVLWTSDGIRPGTRIVGTAEVIYVVPSDINKAYALRARDGKRLSVPQLSKWLTAAIHIADDSFTIVETKNVEASGAKTRMAVVKRIAPFEEQTQWEQHFPTDCLVSQLDDRWLAVVAPDGQWKLVDLETGDQRTLQNIALAELKASQERYLVADPNHLYLILNQRQRTFFSQTLPTVRTHGRIMAFDRQTGKQLWSQRIEEQALVLRRLDVSPYLLFAFRKQKRRGPHLAYQTLHLILVDKQSGKRVIDTEVPTSYSHFNDVDVNLAEHYIELRMYNERLRLVASHPTDAEH